MIRSSIVVALASMSGLLLLPDPGLAQAGTSVFSVLETDGRRIGVGEESQGTLTEADLLSAGGHRVQVWVLDTPPGQEIQVDLRSSDFDPYLYLVGPAGPENPCHGSAGKSLETVFHPRI